MLAYLPAIGYLAAVCLWLAVRRRCPLWFHPAAAAIGLTVRLWQGPTHSVLLAFGVAAGIFVVTAPVLAKRLTPVGFLCIIVALALLPLGGWWAPAVGFGLAAVFSAAQVMRDGGAGRLALMADETFAAVGVSPAGLTKPDLRALPTRGEMRKAAHPRTYLPPFVLAGVLLAALLVAVS